MTKVARLFEKEKEEAVREVEERAKKELEKQQLENAELRRKLEELTRLQAAQK